MTAPTVAEPCFSIGVTTFKRPDLLASALASIRRQTFADFEVIVGNDNPAGPLALRDIGLPDDPRVRILNHARNLGEMRNMNALLAAARGRYFTWLADDDAYAPEFLEAVHAAFTAYGVRCVFTSYTRDPQAGTKQGAARAARLLSGAQFVSGFLNQTIHALGCYGVFDVQHLRSLGGMEQLGRGFSPYSDTLLALRAGRVGNVAYIDAPLVLFRAHAGSQSSTSIDLDAYHTAQADFCARSVPVLRETALDAADFEKNLYQVLSHYCVSYYCAVARRGGSVRPHSTWRYARLMARYGQQLGSRRKEFAEELGRSMRGLLLWAFTTRARQIVRTLRMRAPTVR